MDIKFINDEKNIFKIYIIILFSIFYYFIRLHLLKINKENIIVVFLIDGNCLKILFYFFFFDFSRNNNEQIDN